MRSSMPCFNGSNPIPGSVRLLARSGEVIAQVKSAPRLVIAYPMYNFGIPARLKDWLDNIVAIRAIFSLFINLVFAYV